MEYTNTDYAAEIALQQMYAADVAEWQELQDMIEMAEGLYA